MKILNNKGFTLVELIATIVILVLVMSIGSYAITGLIKKSKETNYKILIENINNAVEGYYQECKYSDVGLIDCPDAGADGYYSTTLGTLVEYGFLKGNSEVGTGANKVMTLVNPNDNENISNCIVKYKYGDGKVIVVAGSTGGACPTGY